MGEVCLADDLMLDRRVALKFVVSAGEHHEIVDQLVVEARAAAALDHPFICKIYEVAELSGRPCIVMEYIAGESLERRLRRGPVPIAEALPIAEEIAEALEAAHKRRIVHRDLKPANVMLTESHHVKVMDFGLAARLPLDRPREGGAIASLAAALRYRLVGTPAYMSPEQASGGEVDRRSDIFAFGVLLFELLSGVQPFHRSGISATLSAIVDEDAPDLRAHAAGIPASAAEIVARMLEKDPAERYQSFAEVRLALRRVSGDLDMRAKPARPSIVEPVERRDARLLIGRQPEQAELLRAIRSAATGHGRVVFVDGEPGIGKSRLAEDALHDARGLGCLTLIGRCYEQPGALPLIPYVEALEEAARLVPTPVFRDAVGRTAPELARLIPELHHLFPDLPPPLDLPPEVEQRFLFNNILDLLTRLSAVVPLVVMIDDLQWADESTMRLTQHLAPHVEKMAVAIVGAFRSADVIPAPPPAASQGFTQFLQRLRGRAHEAPEPATSVDRAVEQLVAQRVARMIHLGPLSEGDVSALLAALGRSDPPAALARRFFEETGGNPFFVEELFRHLHEEGRLFDAQGRWRRDVDADEIDVPASVRTVIERRLQRVDERTRDILTTAAVIGPYFELDLLEAVAATDGGAVLAALEQGERAHLIKPPRGRQERRWRFAHHLICQALLSRLPVVARQRLHLRTADALDLQDPVAVASQADVAHHLYSAGPLADAGRTARALVTAGDAAQAVYATDEAMRHFRHALDILEKRHGLDAGRPMVLERLADLKRLTGDRAGAMTHYQELADLFERIRSRPDYARAVRKIGSLHWDAGERAQARECYDRALAALRDETDHVELAHVCQELGAAAFRNGDNAQAIQWSERALAAAEAALASPVAVLPGVKQMAHTAVAQATNTIGIALARLGQLDAARERVEQSVATAREHGLLEAACRGYANLGVVYTSIEPRRAIEASMTGLEVATRIGATSLQAYLYANLAAAYCALTDRCETEGLEAARAAASIDRELGQLDHLAVPLIVMAQIHQCQGRLDEAQQAYRDALALAERAGEPQLLFPCYDGLATIHLDRGDRRLAEQYMKRAQDVCARAGVDPDALLVLPFLC